MRRNRRVLLCLMVLATTLEAQAVRVTLLDDKSGDMIASGLVALVSAEGRVVARGLTDARGHILLAGAPGRYVVRGDRIGYRGATSGALTLIVGDTLVVRLRMPSDQVVLPEVVVARPTLGCASEGLARPELEAVWGEARKALESTVLTRNQLRPELQVVRVERTRSPEGRLLQEREVSRRPTRGRPYEALSLAELDAHGFARTDGTETVFFAPDADLLLSDPFIATHCFGTVEEGNRVGLSFSPAPAIARPDIEGVMWLQRATGALSEVTFSFVHAPAPYDRVRASGFVRFARVPGNGWIVSEWILAMPRVGVVEGRFLDSRVGGTSRVLSIIEQGGTAAIEAAAGRASLVSITGTVFDSIAMRPLSGVRVGLAGAAESQVTDSRGRYRIGLGVQGPVALRFRHPRLTLLGLPEVMDTAVSGPQLRVDYAIPSPLVWLARFCPRDVADDPKNGALVLRVLDAEGGTIPATTVSVSWTRPSVRDAGNVAVVSRRGATIAMETDTLGAVTFCGVPVQTTLTVRFAGIAATAVKLQGTDRIYLGEVVRPR